MTAYETFHSDTAQTVTSGVEIVERTSEKTVFVGSEEFFMPELVLVEDVLRKGFVFKTCYEVEL